MGNKVQFAAEGEKWYKRNGEVYFFLFSFSPAPFPSPPCALQKHNHTFSVNVEVGLVRLGCCGVLEIKVPVKFAHAQLHDPMLSEPAPQRACSENVYLSEESEVARCHPHSMPFSTLDHFLNSIPR